MENECNELKNQFSEIVSVRNDVSGFLEELKIKIQRLKEIYSDFIKNNNSNNAFLFSLDALRFQSKIIDIEYDDMMRIFYAINNRMYCEYFKMHKIILEYISDNIKQDKLIDSVNLEHHFTPYKDLEPYKQYDFEELKQIHEKIVILISAINSYIQNKQRDLKHHRELNKNGLNLDNFVSTFNYNIVMIQEKMAMFVSYVNYFHKMHLKYFKRFSTKVQLMYSQINNDIKFDKTGDMNSKSQKKDLLNAIASDNKADNKLLRELKDSINDNNNIYRMDSMDLSPHRLSSLSIEPRSPNLSDNGLEINSNYSSSINQVMSNILENIETKLLNEL